MPDVSSKRVLAFFQVPAVRKLSQKKQADLVGRTPETLRRWKRLAKRNEPVAIEDDAWAKMEEILGELPPPDVDSYERGVRATLKRVQALLEALEEELSAPAAGSQETAAQVLKRAQQAAAAQPARKQKRN